MARKEAHRQDGVPKRRRYKAEADLGKIVGDVQAIHAQLRLGPYFPSWRRIYRAGYENLGWAMRKIGYHKLAEACGMPSDPDYYSDSENLYAEIDRLFLSPQWETVREDDFRYFEPVQPNYEELHQYPELFEGVLRAGGITAIFPLRDSFRSLSPSYYLDDGNLKVELEIWMRRLRTKLMPTYSEIEPLHEGIPAAYLVRGGYLKTAQELGLQPKKRYLREPRNLYFELSLIEIARARSEGGEVLENGLPDCYFDMMVTEEEIRAFRRTDLHHAVEAMGGYFHAAQAMGCWLYARFWEANPSLKIEMSRTARQLNHARDLPTADELRELGRVDLVRAIVYNGGVRRTAKMCGLQLQKSVKRNEKPLRAISAKFEPYPFRRLSTDHSEKIGNFNIRFEIPQDAKEGLGQVEEYGVWVFPAKDPTLTQGRVGWIRRRPGAEDLWLHRVEGEGRWSGMFKQDTQQAALSCLLTESWLTGGSVSED